MVKVKGDIQYVRAFLFLSSSFILCDALISSSLYLNSPIIPCMWTQPAQEHFNRNADDRWIPRETETQAQSHMATSRKKYSEDLKQLEWRIQVNLIDLHCFNTWLIVCDYAE